MFFHGTNFLKIESSKKTRLFSPASTSFMLTCHFFQKYIQILPIHPIRYQLRLESTRQDMLHVLIY